MRRGAGGGGGATACGRRSRGPELRALARKGIGRIRDPIAAREQRELGCRCCVGGRSEVGKMGKAEDVHVSFDAVRDKNLMQLKKLNTSIFPVSYQEKFYTDALSSGDFTKLAYYADLCVGSIACRLEKKEGSSGIRLYIMTLGVLAPYRRIGIGSKLLKKTLELCEQDSSITEVYLHVQTNNDAAIEFYKKFDFEITETIENYYKHIEPPDCYVLSKTLAPSSRAKTAQ